MALDWKAFVNFGGKDEISGAVDNARRSTEKAGKGMGDSLSETGKKADALKEKIGGIGDIAKGVALGNLISKGIESAISGAKNLIASVNEFAARAAAAGKEASKIGLSAEGFQKLAYAASQSNVPAEKLSGAFNVLNKNLGQFQLGSGNLYKHLKENDKALYDQVRAAKTNTEVFGVLADAISRETDIGKRAALGNAALGKSWAELYPLLAQGAEGIKAAGDAIPDLITDRQVAMANAWNSTWTEIKRSIQGFCDIIRGAVVQYIGPYVLALKDWIANNRELIKEKIHEYVQKAVVVFKKAVGIIQELVGRVQKLIQFFKEWGPIILAVGAAVGILLGIASAVIAIKNAITMMKSAFAILNAIMAANPVGIIVIAVAAAVAGFVLLTKKVGGVVPALEVVGQTLMKFILTPVNLLLDVIKVLLPIGAQVGAVLGGAFTAIGQTIMKFFLTPINFVLDAVQVLLPIGARIGVVLTESFTTVGQTIMKVLLTPINLVIEGIKGVLTIASKLPGVGNMAKGALEAVDAFQKNMNASLTGSASTLIKDGPGALFDPAKNTKATMADKIAAAESSAMQGAANIGAFQNRMNSSLTGSDSTLFNSGLSALTDPAKAAIAAMPEAMENAAAKGLAAAGGIQGFQDSMNKMLTGGPGTIYGGAINGAVAGFQKEGIAGAIKGGVSGGTNVIAESYDSHRAEYLRNHPDEAPGTKPVADGAEGKWDEMISKFDEMIKAQGATTGAVLELQDSGQNSPAALRWGKMGQEDFWETQRQGI